MNYLSNLALLLAAATTGLVIWAGKRSTVSPVLTIAWVIHSILWNLLPLLLQQTVVEGLETSSGPWARSELALLHSAMMLILVLVHLAFRRPYIGTVRQFFDRTAPPTAHLMWPTFAALILMVVLSAVTASKGQGSFNDSVMFAVTADNSELAQNGIIEVLVTVLVGYAMSLVSLGGRGGITRGTLILAWITLLVFSAFSIARGSRASILLPVVAGVIAISTLQGRVRRRAIATVATLSVITVVLGAPVAGIMGIARGRTDAVSVSLVEDAYTYLFAGATLGAQATLLATEVNRKFDAIGPGVELLAMEAPGTAGVRPLLSAALSPIPRAIYLDKPVPTSRDGTYFGTPYRIAAKAFGDPEMGMIMPVSASAISLWEFGALGPLALLLANLINLVMLNSVYLSRNVLARALGLSLLGLPSAEFFVAGPSSLLQNGLRVGLYLVILMLATLGVKMLRNSLGAPRPTWSGAQLPEHQRSV